MTTTAVSPITQALTGSSTTSSVTGGTNLQSLIGSSAPATTQVGPNANNTQMNQFLQLLMTELQNQDPTQPTDPTQFVTQLAQFSTVEQLTQSNTTLTSISQSLGGLAIGQYSSLLNHTVSAPSSTISVPASGSVTENMTFNVTNNSLANPHVSITNSSGTVVGSLPLTSTSGTVTFNGTDGNGNALPAGSYTVALVGTAAGTSGGQTSSAGTLTTTGIVTGVTQQSGGGWDLQLQDGQSVTASAVTSVQQTATSQN
jgi:flagellar basal-body rod modification protein FlgD